MQKQFLDDLASRPWNPASQSGFQPSGLYIGKGVSAIEVAVAFSSTTPNSTKLRKAWIARRSGRPAPVLLVILHRDGAALCGATGEQPPVYLKLDARQVEQLCREVLVLPDRHAVLQFLEQALPSLETALPGLNNEGLVAMHELQHGTPKRSDWKEAGRKATAILDQQNQKLLLSLGYQIEKLDNLTQLLRSSNHETALAVLLQDGETPEKGTVRFNNLTPVKYAFAKAEEKNLPWVLMVQGNRLRLYSTTIDTGVGRRGRFDTYIECQQTLVANEHLAYIWLLFSAEALAPNGSLVEIIDDSERYAGNLAKRLRERIYDEVVPTLAQGINVARDINSPSLADLEKTYEMALTVLFRILFIAYAEDSDLLPYSFNNAYRRRSLKQKAQDLAESIDKGKPIAENSLHWQEVALLWQAIETGNREWGVPAYNGGLFSNDPKVSTSGAELAKLNVPNIYFEAALRAFLVVETMEGVSGPVDFRSLSVREFGTIYEGLLESELALANTNLFINSQGDYVPAIDGDSVKVNKGEVYLHNRSGKRKSSGSYYTKQFAVEHLLDGVLEPALQSHFIRLGKMDDTEASKAFFDFRVADIAMGSGHFLIATIDRIEKGMANFLTKRNLPGVQLELAGLNEAAHQELGELAEVTTIKDGQLLRRLIARRCIYGVDINALSVQLARLAVWIHTFVPGLPLSMLDHTLVQGNSLIGIGTVEDIRDKFKETTGTLFPADAEGLLGQAAAPLRRLANINDATLQDIEAARSALREVSKAVEETEALCDLITARPVSTNEKVVGFPFENWEQCKNDEQTLNAVHAARCDLEGLQALHFPVAFPEVFLRQKPGFDVILGNPPWQETTVEEDAFWARHFPGLGGLSRREQEKKKSIYRKQRPDLLAIYNRERKEMELLRNALHSSKSFPGMGTGDPDLYKAFCWRFWHLATTIGGIGVVLPRSTFATKGSQPFRMEVFTHSNLVEVIVLKNRQKWVFDDVSEQYTVCLFLNTKSDKGPGTIKMRGPFYSLEDFLKRKNKQTKSFSLTEVLLWNDAATLPVLPTDESIDIFAQLRKAPRLDLNINRQWRARPDREMDATNQIDLMDLESEECPEGYWPVLGGRSFDIWTPDNNANDAWADSNTVFEFLQNKRLRAKNRRSDSVHREFSFEFLHDSRTLPCCKARIAFRDIARATDRRTVIPCLIPPKVFLTNTAPYLLWPRGDEMDQAYLLGILSSIPLDWYARRYVELHVNFFVFNPFPVPRPTRHDIRWKRVINLAGRLACPDERFANWAKSVGVEYGSLDPDEKDDMIYELDAVAAHLYGLSYNQLVHIFETFHDSWVYQQRLDAVLQHYQEWAGKQ